MSSFPHDLHVVFLKLHYFASEIAAALPRCAVRTPSQTSVWAFHPSLLNPNPRGRVLTNDAIPFRAAPLALTPTWRSAWPPRWASTPASAAATAPASRAASATMPARTGPTTPGTPKQPPPPGGADPPPGSAGPQRGLGGVKTCLAGLDSPGSWRPARCRADHRTAPVKAADSAQPATTSPAVAGARRCATRPRLPSVDLPACARAASGPALRAR